MENQLVVFALAGEYYGVNIASVESIVKMQTITSVPRAPQFVQGVTNLRGEVLPVIDLGQHFELPSHAMSQDTRIVVVDMGGAKVGMIVDAVSEVLRVSEGAIEPLSPMMATTDSPFIQGIAKVDERLIIVLDLGKLLSSQERATLQTITAAS
jgi:purine-binding chemotaxis protein CheW